MAARFIVPKSKRAECESGPIGFSIPKKTDFDADSGYGTDSCPALVLTDMMTECHEGHCHAVDQCFRHSQVAELCLTGAVGMNMTSDRTAYRR